MAYQYREVECQIITRSMRSRVQIFHEGILEKILRSRPEKSPPSSDLIPTARRANNVTHNLILAEQVRRHTVVGRSERIVDCYQANSEERDELSRVLNPEYEPSCYPAKPFGPGNVWSTNCIHELRIINHVLAEEHRKTTEDKIMLAGARSVRCQGTKKGSRVDAAKLDGHAATIDLLVTLRPADSIGKPDNGRISGTGAKQARCELGRKIVANDEFRFNTSV